MQMNRRQFLSTAALPLLGSALPAWAQSVSADQKLLVMVYLKGGNDGYNTLVPFSDSLYRRLRPNIALPREQLIHVNETHGFHAALKPLIPLWDAKELAVVQGIGQQEITNQHYRDAETLFTASAPDQYLTEGWMTRVFSTNPSVGAAIRAKLPEEALHALCFGDLDIRESDPMGPFRGEKQRIINMQYAHEWLRAHRVRDTVFLATPNAKSAAQKFALANVPSLKTSFPTDPFGQSLRAAAELAAAGVAPPVIHITLNALDDDQHHAWDTHWEQFKYHGEALKRLAEGLAAFRNGMMEIGRWNDTLLFTYDEFGRSPKETEDRGTQHGWTNMQFVAGGRIKGGLHGAPMPVVNVFSIDGAAPTTDYRALYTTAIEGFFGGSAAGVFAKRFAPLDVLKA